jgi:glyoxylase-like metal-dependent hydrolase (beta-lactamase superfamily II)
MLKIEKFVVNPLQENSWVISDETGECVFIDPGFYYDEEFDEIRDYISSRNLKPVKILNTHCHFDHLMGVGFIRNEFGVPFFAHPADNFWVEKAVEQAQMFGFEMSPVQPADGFFNDNEQVCFGNSVLEIIHVPGHSPGHVAFYHAGSASLLAGDILFYGSIGRTDLPGGNYQTLISAIKNRLFVLPADTKVYCGHGPETTLGFEMQNNPFLT